MKDDGLFAHKFGKNFVWGVAIAAQQNEGGRHALGRSDSIWDTFADKKSKIKNGHVIGDACDYVHRYKEDHSIVQNLGFNAFRFSISWSRLIPEGIGVVNKKAVEFYDKIIDDCIKKGLTPYVTLYHWDLPEILEKEGGWTSHRMLIWFSYYVKACAEAFGDRVKHWIVLNEPMGYTSLGYFLGKHAPGKRGFSNFFPAVHQTLLCQAEGGRIIRDLVPNAIVGTTFSCSKIVPYTDSIEDINAAKRVDALMNRLFLEPVLGMGYPKVPGFKLLEKIELHNLGWRHKEKMQFDFDFIGLQNYFPLTVKYNPFIPYLFASEVKPLVRKVLITGLGWEVNSQMFGAIIEQFASYENIKNILVTENGASFRDTIKNGVIDDKKRIAYYHSHLKELLRLKNKGLPITGYFSWTLTDNFEWSFGYNPTFGLVHVNRDTQERTLKQSAHWFRQFLRS